MARTGTTFEILRSLEDAKRTVQTKLSKIGDDPNLVMRAEVLLQSFNEMLDGIYAVAPQIEQLKGLTKGIQLAEAFAGQHREILKQKLPDVQHADLLKFGIQIVGDCCLSVKDGAKKQREELLKTTGKMEGAVKAATDLLRRVEKFIENHDRALQAAQEIDQDAEATSEVDALLEAQAQKRAAEMAEANKPSEPEAKPKPSKGNGVRPQQVASFSAKKKGAKKKAKKRARKVATKRS